MFSLQLFNGFSIDWLWRVILANHLYFVKSLYTMKMYLEFKNTPYKNMASVCNHDGRLFLSKFIKRKYIGGIFIGLILSKQKY